jgi:glycosyltransferase involved in cell wall biosynthesis
MHILFITHRFFPKHGAGTEVLTLQLAKGFSARGYRTTVFTGEHDEQLSCDEPLRVSNDTYDGLPVYRLHFGKAEQTWRHQGLVQKAALGARLLKGGLDPVALHVNAADRVAMARDLVIRLKPDLVHINHLIGFSSAVVPAIRSLDVPVVFTPTDYFAVCPTDQLLHRFDHQVCEGPGDAIDCVRCLHSMPRWVAGLAMRASRTPFLGGSGAMFRSLAGRQHAIARDLNMTDRVMPSTRFLADVLARHGVERQRIRVTPYGIDIGELPAMIPVPARFDSTSPLRVGFIGKLEGPKGAHVLVNALRHLGERIDAVRMEIYAAIRPDEEYCRNLMQDAQTYGQAVRFAGTFPPDQIGTILRSMHVLVVPSIWYESIPLVLRSSLNAGVPVIVSEMGGLTEPLSGNMRKMSFAAGDDKALSRLIEGLLDDPSRLTRLRAELEGQSRSLADYLDDVEAEYRLITAPHHEPREQTSSRR